MKFLVLLILVLQYNLYSEFEVNQIESLDCDCDSFESIFFNETTNNIIITCEEGKFVSTNTNFSDCEKFQISDENDAISDVLNLNYYFYFASRNPSNPTEGRLYSTNNKTDFQKFELENSFPTNLFVYNQNAYSLSYMATGSKIYKIDENNFEYVNQVPLHFWDIKEYQGLAVGIGASPSIGGYIYKSENFITWEPIPLSNIYKMLRSAEVINNYLYVTGENGEIIIFDKNFKELDTYILGENIRIYDIILENQTNNLFVLTFNKGNNIAQLIYLNLETKENEVLKEFDAGIKALEFIRLNDVCHFITSNGFLHSINKITDVTSKENQHYVSKQFINKNNILKLLNENNYKSLYDINGKSISFENLVAENYLIGITGEKVVIIKTF